MKNVTQTLSFPSVSIIPTKLSDEVNELMAKAQAAKAAYDQAAAAKGGPEADPDGTLHATTLLGLKAVADEAAEALQAALPEQTAKELAHFGAKSPLETVAVTLKLGTLLFDLYALGTPKPDAPLHQLIWQKRSMELAEKVDQDEFELPSWSVGAIRRALLDDKVWKEVNVSAWVELAATSETEAVKRFFTMKSQGAQFYNEIMQAAAEALYTDELMGDAK